MTRWTEERGGRITMSWGWRITWLLLRSTSFISYVYDLVGGAAASENFFPSFHVANHTRVTKIWTHVLVWKKHVRLKRKRLIYPPSRFMEHQPILPFFPPRRVEMETHRIRSLPPLGGGGALQWTRKWKSVRHELCWVRLNRLLYIWHIHVQIWYRATFTPYGRTHFPHRGTTYIPYECTVKMIFRPLLDSGYHFYITRLALSRFCDFLSVCQILR